jgi:CHAD domain-containing protein
LSRKTGAPPRESRVLESKHAHQWVLEARVVHRATRAASAIVAAGVVYVPERLHDARIALKRLRYAAELLASAGDRNAARSLAPLKASQDALGRLHDLEVLIERTRREQVTLTPPDLTAWRELSALVHALENDCRRLHGMFLQQRSSLLEIARELGAAPEKRASRTPA